MSSKKAPAAKIKISGENLEPVFGPERAADFKRCIPELSKAYKAFGYKPKVDLEDGLKKTFNWWKSGWNTDSK